MNCASCGGYLGFAPAEEDYGDFECPRCGHVLGEDVWDNDWDEDEGEMGSDPDGDGETI